MEGNNREVKELVLHGGSATERINLCRDHQLPESTPNTGSSQKLPSAHQYGIDHDHFQSTEVWRAASMELIGTAVLVFLSTSAVLACLQGGSGYSPKILIPLLHVFIVWLCILAAGPVSGGHLNPCITFACMLTGFTSPIRAFLYIMAQAAGSLLGAWLVTAIVSPHLYQKYSLAGCLFQSDHPMHTQSTVAGGTDQTGSDDQLGVTQAIVSEFCYSFALLFVAFMVVFDPKSFRLSGPILSPLLVGLLIGILIFISAGFTGEDGYTGAGMNPARCFGPAAVLLMKKMDSNDILYHGQWVFWAGPSLAALLMALIYHIIPPQHAGAYQMRMDLLTRIRSSLRRPKLFADGRA